MRFTSLSTATLPSTLMGLLLTSQYVQVAEAFEYLVGVGKSENTGKNGVGFDPSSIRPQPGDTIVFEFHAGTHKYAPKTLLFKASNI
jgi:plastocyanin